MDASGLGSAIGGLDHPPTHGSGSLESYEWGSWQVDIYFQPARCELLKGIKGKARFMASEKRHVRCLTLAVAAGHTSAITLIHGRVALGCRRR